MRMFVEDSGPENRRCGGICAVVKIKLKRVLANYFVNIFHWVKG